MEMFDSDTPYINHLNRLTPDDIYDGLLGYGLFCDKLPPVLTSEPFLDYCKNTANTSSKKQGHDWIRFTYRRNIGRLREFGIPNPFAYEHLVKAISNNWGDLTQFFAKHTAIQKYCCRYRQDSFALYDNPIGPPSGASTRPAASRPGSGGRPTRSPRRTSASRSRA